MISFALDDAEEVKKYLIDQGLEIDISMCFSSVQNPFNGLETEYMQNKFYDQKFNLIIIFVMFCMVMMLSTLCRNQLLDESDNFQYVPLLEDVTHFLQHPEIFDEVHINY